MSAQARTKSATVIRPADERDIPTIIAIAKATWPVAYRDMLTPEQIDNMLTRIYCDENLRYEMMIGHRFWIAEHGGESAGYASAYIEGDGVWLKKLYVLPEKQSLGIGQKLVATVSTSFPGQRELCLLTNPDNHAGKRFYAKAGFTCVGEMPVKMGDYAFTDLIFAKPLPR